MEQRPTYRFLIKSKRTGKKIKHYLNGAHHGLFVEASKDYDNRVTNMALGIVMALMEQKNIYVEVYKLNEQEEYELIRTQF